MFQAVSPHLPAGRLIFKAAAVADYTPAQYSGDKMKKKERGAVHPSVPHP